MALKELKHGKIKGFSCETKKHLIFYKTAFKSSAN